MDATCLSIKSKKNPTDKCLAKAIKGDFCARHAKSKILWNGAKRVVPFTRKQRLAAEKIYRFWILHGRRKLIKEVGFIFTPEYANNEKDILTHEDIRSVPLKYRFAYIDSSNHLWLFDLRFFVQLIHYGNEIKNPFSQEILSQEILERLQKKVERLRSQKIPIIYSDGNELTPEQIWNQKVLNVFLKINSLGYGVNVIWFETMQVRNHENFYKILYNLWMNIPEEERDRLVPGHDSGRSPLFRWIPQVLLLKSQELKWWRKINLTLMNSFVNRSEDKTMQSSGALYVITALANSHRQVAEAFSWLAFNA